MNRYLELVEEPKDIKNLSLDQLRQLAEEIRYELITVLSRNGGHLGPNLGVVELTLALHRVFSTPTDKFVWDVSHQVYVHKLLTGRKERFDTIRMTNGLNGFALRAESPHDCYGAGHAGTALSAALGMAAARDRRGTREHIVCIFGDAALTNGISFEALNNIAHTTKRFIGILNDNEWSIAKNVGAISNYLNKLITHPSYNKLSGDFVRFLRRLPKGEVALKLAHKAEEGFKGAIAEEVAPQDKDWLPKISTEIAIPPAVPTGAYKIAVNVEDAVAHTTASLDVPFQVRGRAVPATGTLTVQNMRYYRGEDDTRPLDKPVYKAGDALWVRFDVTGFQYGPNNRVDLSYVFSVLDAAGTALWTAPDPVVDQGESFYPRPYVSGAFSITVQSAVKPGSYAIAIKATDAVGNRTVTAKQPFTVE